MLTFCLNDLSVNEILNSPTIIMLFQISPIGPANNFLHILVFQYLVQSFSHVLLFVTPWTEACQASLSITSSWSLFFFAFSYRSWGSQGKNSKAVCHSLLQWTTFCQNSPPWPACLGWPYRAWLIVALSWTRLWSMWSIWLVFCDWGFHSIFPLMGKDKRLVEASWWERLTVGESGSCSDVY